MFEEVIIYYAFKTYKNTMEINNEKQRLKDLFL